MTDKELLIKELCVRLPYGVKLYFEGINKPILLARVCPFESVVSMQFWYKDQWVYKRLEESKPYLFPLSSMTEEQYKEFNNLNECVEIDGIKGHCEDYTNPHIGSKWYTNFNEHSEAADTELQDYLICIDWLNKNHFDYRGLIDKGLAIDATNLNIY